MKKFSQWSLFCPMASDTIHCTTTTSDLFPFMPYFSPLIPKNDATIPLPSQCLLFDYLITHPLSSDLYWSTPAHLPIHPLPCYSICPPFLFSIPSPLAIYPLHTILHANLPSPHYTSDPSPYYSAFCLASTPSLH